jgi:hypothetical protein
MKQQAINFRCSACRTDNKFVYSKNPSRFTPTIFKDSCHHCRTKFLIKLERRPELKEGDVYLSYSVLNLSKKGLLAAESQRKMNSANG